MLNKIHKKLVACTKTMYLYILQCSCYLFLSTFIFLYVQEGTENILSLDIQQVIFFKKSNSLLLFSKYSMDLLLTINIATREAFLGAKTKRVGETTSKTEQNIPHSKRARGSCEVERGEFQSKYLIMLY